MREKESRLNGVFNIDAWVRYVQLLLRSLVETAVVPHLSLQSLSDIKLEGIHWQNRDKIIRGEEKFFFTALLPRG